MKKIKLIGLLTLLTVYCSGQNSVFKVVEYRPAPGQHINIEANGTPQAAHNMSANENSSVSLGSFGGYIVLQFINPCGNDPENPYGIDFTIFGNAFKGSSEPGVIWVMNDKNHNNIPDDTWYEIAGSQYFHGSTIKQYQITYFKTETRNVEWQDNLGQAGIIKANSYNMQEYYPVPAYFPDYPQDSVVFNGTLMAANINRSNPAEFKIEPLDFGYADNHPKKQGFNPAIPDNPYSQEVEGAGGDPVDISWAVDSFGNYVDLQSVSFVKIATGYLQDLDWLGEASTDVSNIVDVEPNAAISGPEKLLVFYPLQPQKIVVGDIVEPAAILFKNGKPQEETIKFASSAESVARFGPLNILKAQNAGVTEISATSDGLVKTQSLKVVTIDSVQIAGDFSAVYPGDSVLIEARIFDNEGDLIERSVTFELPDAETGTMVSIENKHWFVALNPGVIEIKCKALGAGFWQSKTFKVRSPSDKIKILFTAKTEDENLFPLQQIEVGLSDLNPFIENPQKNYSEINRHTLAHAIVEGLKKASVNFAFRDDTNSIGKLYLYFIENDGFFTYGWGGKTIPQPFAKAWIVRLNGHQYLNDFDTHENFGR